MKKLCYIYVWSLLLVCFMWKCLDFFAEFWVFDSRGDKEGI